MDKEKRRGAPLGNRNSIKWTTDKAQLLIDNLYEYIKNDDECRSMALACVKNDTYEDILGYFKTIFDEGDVDFRPIKKGEEIIKARLMEQALGNSVNTTMAIFILKNNHGMADKVEQKTEVKVEESVTIFELPNNNR